MPRIEWTDLPDAVRARVERALRSTVVSHESQPGGWSPGTADRVVLETGRRAFVKAVHADLNPTSPDLHRRELAVLRGMPDRLPVPRLITGFEQSGWGVLVLDDVAGTHPSLPWRPKAFAAALDAVQEISDRLTPCPIPGLPAAFDRLEDDWRGFEKMRTVAIRDLDPWLEARIDELHLRALRSLTTLGGDTVCHGDLRADNLLMRPDGGYVVIDWAWACRGASWLDATLLTIELISGGTAAAFREADAVLTRLASENGATTQALADCLVGATAYYTWHSRQPAAEGMPDLRTYQRRLGDALTGWLKATSLS